MCRVGPAPHRVRVDPRDDAGDEDDPAHRLEEREEPEREERHRRELGEVRDHVEPGHLRRDRQDAARGADGEQAAAVPQRQHAVDESEHERDQHEPEEGDVPPERLVPERARRRVVGGDDPGEDAEG